MSLNVKNVKLIDDPNISNRLLIFTDNDRLNSAHG